MNKYVLLVSAVLMAQIPVRAQLQNTYASDTLRLGLKEAVTYALENSPSSRSIYHNYQSAYWTYRSSRSVFFPQLSLNGDVPGYTHVINAITQPDGTVLYIPQSQSISRAAVTLSQNIFPSGGSLFVSSSLGRITLYGNQDATYWQTQPLVVGISQPLFRVNYSRFNWKQARLRYRSATKREIEAGEDLSLQVVDAWFNLYIARLELLNAETNVAINDTLYRISKGRFDLGKIAETELLQVEFSLLNARNNVEQTQLRMKQAEQQLRITCGIKNIVPVAIPEASPDISNIKVDEAVAMNEATVNRSDFEQMHLQENNNLMALREASLKRFFQGDLNASFGLNQTAGSLPDAYRNTLNSQIFSIGFNLPLVTFGRNRGDYLAAQNQNEAFKADMQNQVNTLLFEVGNAAQQIKQLEQSVRLSERSNEIAAKRYELSKNRYLVGKIDITNLTIAQNEKDQALLNYAGTLRNYWNAYYRLRRLTLYDFEAQGKIK